MLLASAFLAAGCHRTYPPVAPASVAVAEEPCWWTLFRSPLPLDTVATHLANAFTTLGLGDATRTRQGDTIRVHAGPARLDDRFGATYSARMVAFRRGDSTLYRYFVATAPPRGGWPPSYDSVTTGGGHISVNPAGSTIGFCNAIARSAQNNGTAPKEPNGEESLPVWRRSSPSD